MAFIEYFLTTKNMTQLALGDWLVPTRKSCFVLPEFQNKETAWDVSIAAASHLRATPWLGVPGYTEWQDRAALPILQEYFADRVGLEETCRRLEAESTLILARYQKRNKTIW